MSDEQLTDLFKALSNTTRLRIVQLLKDPEKTFLLNFLIKEEKTFQEEFVQGYTK